MVHGSGFSGMGGFDLAAQWIGWENKFHCEWNPFGQKILKYYWPKAKSYHDIKQSDFSIHEGEIDVFTAGFPCQGFSLAGNRLGTEDDRYLWPETRRAYRQFKPRIIVGENVTGILSMEDKSGVWSEIFPRVENRKIVRYDTVDHYEAIYTRQAKMLVSSICEDLEEDGYEVQPIAVPACSLGAPHKRERIWFIAYATGDRWGRKRSGSSNEDREQGPEHGGILERGFEGFCSSGFIADPKHFGLPQWNAQQGFGRTSKDADRCSSERKWQDFPTQSPVCSGNDGLSGRLDGITFPKWRSESIKAAGNAIVPQVALQIFKAIQEYENITTVQG